MLDSATVDELEATVTANSEDKKANGEDKAMTDDKAGKLRLDQAKQQVTTSKEELGKSEKLSAAATAKKILCVCGTCLSCVAMCEHNQLKAHRNYRRL